MAGKHCTFAYINTNRLPEKAAEHISRRSNARSWPTPSGNTSIRFARAKAAAGEQPPAHGEWRRTATATLQPADSYNVTTLLSGDIVSAPFEEGDLVAKDTLLYTMDSSDAQDSMDRAQISVQQAQLSYQQAQEALHPTAPISGTVSEVYVHNGESVTAGAQLARIVASTELSIDFLFTYASPSDFYVGQPATVFFNGYDGTQAGTVTNVSNASTITSDGKQAVSVRVRLNNPGAVSDAGTASAVVGSYSSYGQSPVSMPASSIVYASGSGTELISLAGFVAITVITGTSPDTSLSPFLCSSVSFSPIPLTNTMSYFRRRRNSSGRTVSRLTAGQSLAPDICIWVMML